MNLKQLKIKLNQKLKKKIELKKIWKFKIELNLKNEKMIEFKKIELS